ncbi:DUF998 domain-containing protein [Arenibacter arenosicollis]|uniref:DUF998 domain-containing protein n=1 Tax=Arenibacter arenosicollis TaxID=2762274 RepID=UPI001CA4574F|nr:DUF998 domain-containing protein [Arenibacter arenosicollis]
MVKKLYKIKHVIFWSGLGGVIFFVAASVIGGLLLEAYSHNRQLISESYAKGTEYGPILRWGAIIPSGSLMSVFAFLSPMVLPKSLLVKLGFWGLGLFYGMATIVVGIFPCDAGCNPELIDPSTSQIIHNFSGGLTYLTVPFCILAVGLGSKNFLRRLSAIFGLMSIVFMWLLLGNLNSSYLGLFQRLLEGSILVWICYVSIFIKKL